MHVAFWCPAWPLKQFQNGIVTYVHWMKCELERRGHRVSVFTNSALGSKDDGVHQVAPSLTTRLLWRIRRIRKAAWQQLIFRAYDESARAIQLLHRHYPIEVLEMEESFGWFAELA